MMPTIHMDDPMTPRAPASASAGSTSGRWTTGRCLVVAAVVLLGYLAVVGYEGKYGPTMVINGFGSNDWPNREMLSDRYNRKVYYTRAQFLPDHLTPYVDVFSEYPTITTLLFAAPLLLAPKFRMSPGLYSFVWSCFMAALLFGTIWLVAAFRTRRGLVPAAALILLSPSAMYFALNRADIVGAFVLCTSLAAFARRRYALAYGLLAVGTYIKWYPMVVLPVFLAYHLAQDLRIPDGWRPSALLRGRAVRYASTYAILIAAFTGASLLWFGWKGLMVPYRFHAVRGGQYFNPYYVFEHLRAPLLLPTLERRILNGSFLALQWSIVPILLVKRVRSLSDVFRFSVLALYLFITFSRIDSPEWILWYLPLSLMFVDRTRTLVALAALGVVNYVVCPFAWGTLWPAMSFSIIVFAKDLLLLGIVVAIFREPGTNALDELPPPAEAYA